MEQQLDIDIGMVMRKSVPFRVDKEFYISLVLEKNRFSDRKPKTIGAIVAFCKWRKDLVLTRGR